MVKFDFENKKKVHFIGIGGISMSAIALILLKNGFIVQGSDQSLNENVKMLKDKGIKIFIGHNKENITSDIDIVVYSKAIHSDNEEFMEAEKLGLTLMSRSKILGEIMANYKQKICIAGTHGKTTTTSLVSKVLLDIKLNPTINVGGIVDEIGGNSYISDNKDLFVAEACEYTNSFLDFVADIEVITNIEEDHLDFFKDLDDIRKSFKKFIELLPDNGFLVINNRIENIDELTKNTKARIIIYGDDQSADYYFDNVSYDDNFYQSFDVYKKKTFIGRMRQKLIGRHNALNFLAAFAVLDNLGVDFETVKNSLMDFKGARRRLELKGVKDNISYIDDYAHHPTEIEASIKALNELKYNDLYLIFQPHTFTRTKALFKDFVRVLGDIPNVILAKIYPAREIDDGSISANDIKNSIKNDTTNKNNICEYFEKFEDIIDFVSKKAKKNDIIVTMGAGDIYKLHNLLGLK